MSDSSVLDQSSLAVTLWNLEEARLAGRNADLPRIRAALDWVVSRFRLPGSYRGLLFAPTPTDIEKRRATPTGEDGSVGRGGVAHMLGEEATRTLLRHGRTEGWDHETVLREIAARFQWTEVGGGPGRAGRFCCIRCSIARWRALSAGAPHRFDDVLSDGLRMLREDADPARGWQRFPFYYTLLALADMPHEDSEPERKRVRTCAERRLKRLTCDDQQTRFRRRALEWALSS